MRFPRLTGLAIASLIVLAVLLGACTRSAATPAPSTPQAQTTAGMTGQQATMEAVRSALLTQTAQAAAGSGAASSTPLVVVTQGTPSAPQATLGTGTPKPTTPGRHDLRPVDVHRPVGRVGLLHRPQVQRRPAGDH